MEKELKLAILIDAENISSKYVEVILSEANNLGNIIYKRIYGNWTMPQMGAWKDVILDNSIQPIQQYSNISGKNSSDSSLIIDAMDLLYLNKLDGFCIVSSDSDFTRLATRLRESEMFVMGMGEQKTPRSFISACSKFLYLDLLLSSSSSGKTAEQKEKRSNVEEEKKADESAKQNDQNAIARIEEKAGSNIKIIKQTLQELVEENSDDDGWIFSAKLKELLNKRFPDFDERNFKNKKFVPFVKSLDLFVTKAIPVKENETSKLIYFRLK